MLFVLYLAISILGGVAFMEIEKKAEVNECLKLDKDILKAKEAVDDAAKMSQEFTVEFPVKITMKFHLRFSKLKLFPDKQKTSYDA